MAYRATIDIQKHLREQFYMLINKKLAGESYKTEISTRVNDTHPSTFCQQENCVRRITLCLMD